MKKIFILIIALAFSSLSFAWDDTEPTNIDFDLSKNVYYEYNYDNTTSAYYVLGTHHLQGSRVFATSNNVNKIYYQDKGEANIGKVNLSNISIPAAADNVTFDGDWKEL